MKITMTGKASVFNTEETRKRDLVVSYNIILSANFGKNIWVFHIYSVIRGHLRTFAHGRLYQIMALMYFSGKIYLFHMGGKPSTFPFLSTKECHPRKQEGDNGRSFCVPSTKIQQKKAKVCTAHRWCWDPHGFLYSWKMVSDELRTWGELRLAKYKVHYSLQRECHWVILVVEFLFLQGPHLTSDSLSQYCPPLPFLKKKRVAYLLWGSYARRIDRGEGAGLGTGTQRGTVPQRREGGSPTEYIDT